MTTHSTSGEEFDLRIDLITSRQPAYRSLLTFFKKVREKQISVTVDDTDLPKVPSAKKAESRLETGFPLLDVSRLKFPRPEVSTTAGLILDLIKAQEKEEGADLGMFDFLTDPSDKAAGEIFLHAALHEMEDISRMAMERSMAPALLIFLARASLKPLFWFLKDGFSGRYKEILWDEGICPLCGNPPAIAKLEGEGGKRYLLCSLCEFEYRFSRIKCSHCGTTDQNKMRYFFPEGTSRELRVALCDNCNHYLKTVDSRLYPPEEGVVMPLEDVATIHLDMVAEKMGFLPLSVGSLAFPMQGRGI